MTASDNILGFGAFAIFLGAIIYLINNFTKWRAQSAKCYVTAEAVSEKFDWRTNTPFKYRPFKPVYHMVMNISKAGAEDWLRIEDTYDTVTEIHKEIMDTNPDETIKINDSPETKKAMQELYNLVVGVLVQRYPKYFVADGKVIHNTIKRVDIPRNAASSGLSAKQLLRILCENTEEDFQLLEFDPTVDEFRLRGIGGLTSDGYSWRKKLNYKLTDVHGPVPGYKEKLKFSMNRFFGKLQPGSFIERTTWGVHVGPKNLIYHPHRRSVEEKEKSRSIELSDVDWENQMFLRVERQVPTKLPVTGFLILTQHTYMYSLADVKREGLGPAMADGIVAWTPEFASYKGRDEWGEVVLSYLRS